MQIEEQLDKQGMLLSYICAFVHLPMSLFLV